MKRHKPERRIRIRAIKRTPPDLRKLGRAVIALALAQAQAEKEAEAEHKRRTKAKRKPQGAKDG